MKNFSARTLVLVAVTLGLAIASTPVIGTVATVDSKAATATERKEDRKEDRREDRQEERLTRQEERQEERLERQEERQEDRQERREERCEDRRDDDRRCQLSR